MLDPTLEEGIRARFANAEFARWMGIELVSLGVGESEIALDLEPHHLNPGGIVHGGTLATLLDVAIGLANRTRLGMEATHVTVQLHVNYIRAVRTGRLRALGTSIHSGARIGYGEATVVADDGTTVARASGTFLNLPATGLDGE